MKIPVFHNEYASLGGEIAHPVACVAAPNPDFVYVNHLLGENLGLPEGWLGSPQSLAIFGGKVSSGITPVAMAYAGHQFGQLVPVLGDGRALLLGEIHAPDGQVYDVHLKGSGITPFSRTGDGKAPLGAVLREVIIGHAMTALGIASSQALAALTTGETIDRGGEPNSGAMLVRIAKGHLRIGTFEYFAIRGKTQQLAQLADFAIRRWHTDITQHPNRHLALLQRIVASHAQLVADWMHVGFIHGVMNTDNASISGETFDYGPCAFMDTFRPGQVYSSIDHKGRYAYANQPVVAHWNLCRLAEALLPLLDDNQKKALTKAQQAVAAFPELYDKAWTAIARAKLGLKESDPGDKKMAQDLLEIVERKQLDFTLSWRGLAGLVTEDASQKHRALADALRDWLPGWRHRIGQEQPAAVIAERIRAANPAVIPRNHQVNKAIMLAEKGDFSFFRKLMQALTFPFHLMDESAFFAKPPQPQEMVYQTFCGT